MVDWKASQKWGAFFLHLPCPFSRTLIWTSCTMQEISAWLNNGRDYDTGVELYEKYGDNGFFKILLKSGATPYIIDRLEVELEGLAPDAPAIPDTSNPENLDDTPHAPASLGIPEIPINPKIPVDIKQHTRYMGLKELQKNLYRQMEHNRTALGMSADQSFLHVTAKQIISLDFKIRDVWCLIDHYDLNGSFPVVQVKEEVIYTSEEKIQLLRVSNSKANRRLKSGKCQNISKTESLIDKNNKEINLLLKKQNMNANSN